MVVVREVSTRGSSAAFPITVYIPYAGWNRTELRASKTEIALLNLLPLLPNTTSLPHKRWCIKRGGGIRRNPPLVHARRMRQFQLPWICRLILTTLLSLSSSEDGARKEKDFPAYWGCPSLLLHCWRCDGGENFLCLRLLALTSIKLASLAKKPKNAKSKPLNQKTPSHEREQREKNSNCTSVQQTFVIIQQQLIETPGL